MNKNKEIMKEKTNMLFLRSSVNLDYVYVSKQPELENFTNQALQSKASKNVYNWFLKCQQTFTIWDEIHISFLSVSYPYNHSIFWYWNEIFEDLHSLSLSEYWQIITQMNVCMQMKA